jgi:hypothetical protein
MRFYKITLGFIFSFFLSSAGYSSIVRNLVELDHLIDDFSLDTASFNQRLDALLSKAADEECNVLLAKRTAKYPKKIDVKRGNKLQIQARLAVLKEFEKKLGRMQSQLLLNDAHQNEGSYRLRGERLRDSLEIVKQEILLLGQMQEESKWWKSPRFIAFVAVCCATAIVGGGCLFWWLKKRGNKDSEQSDSSVRTDSDRADSADEGNSRVENNSGGNKAESGSSGGNQLGHRGSGIGDDPRNYDLGEETGKKHTFDPLSFGDYMTEEQIAEYAAKSYGIENNALQGHLQAQEARAVQESVDWDNLKQDLGSQERNLTLYKNSLENIQRIPGVNFQVKAMQDFLYSQFQTFIPSQELEEFFEQNGTKRISERIRLFHNLFSEKAKLIALFSGESIDPDAGDVKYSMDDMGKKIKEIEAEFDNGSPLDKVTQKYDNGGKFDKKVLGYIVIYEQYKRGNTSCEVTEFIDENGNKGRIKDIVKFYCYEDIDWDQIYERRRDNYEKNKDPLMETRIERIRQEIAKGTDLEAVKKQFVKTSENELDNPDKFDNSVYCGDDDNLMTSEALQKKHFGDYSKRRTLELFAIYEFYRKSGESDPDLRKIVNENWKQIKHIYLNHLEENIGGYSLKGASVSVVKKDNDQNNDESKETEEERKKRIERERKERAAIAAAAAEKRRQKQVKK